MVVLMSVGQASTALLPAGFLKGKDPLQSYVPDELLIKFKPTASLQSQELTLSSHGMKKIRALDRSGWVHLKLPQGYSVEAAMAAYRGNPTVEYVQPNFIYRIATAPNDPSYGQQWALKNIGQPISTPSYSANNPGVAGKDMDMELAWDLITDCTNIVVAVLDTGVNYTHLDLALNMWDGSAAGFINHGFDYVDNDDDPMPQSASSQDAHGTHVAGTIGAVGHNNLGTTGVCWQARIMAVRALSAGIGTSDTVARGVDFAVAQGAKIINMSFGGGGSDEKFSESITRARNAGVLIVVAAGNGHSDPIINDGTGVNNDTVPTYPCNFPQDNILCVAALDQAYALSTFSNYGSMSVDVGAPGVNTISTWPGRNITDDFTGWTFTGGGFAAVSCDLDGPGPLAPFSMLVNPTSWCTFGNYANNANDVAYRTFDLSNTSQALLTYAMFLDTELNTDFAGVAFKSTGGDPFGSGGVITEESGTTNNFAVDRSTDLFNCRTTTCSVGFRLRSNSMNTNFGLGILNFRIDTIEPNSKAYKIINGTSMATPHVSGLAAMVWAYNPAYTYTQVVNAIKNGGESVPALAGKTTTGKAANAMGSLAYINPPTGLSANVE